MKKKDRIICGEKHRIIKALTGEEFNPIKESIIHRLMGLPDIIEKCDCGGTARCIRVDKFRTWEIPVLKCDGCKDEKIFE